RATSPPDTSPRPLPDALPISPPGVALPQGQDLHVVERACVENQAMPHHFRLAPSDRPVTQPASRGSHPELSVDPPWMGVAVVLRSEEHTSELQSRENLVCRLL